MRGPDYDFIIMDDIEVCKVETWATGTFLFVVVDEKFWHVDSANIESHSFHLLNLEKVLI